LATRHLIDSIMRQTTVLIAQLSTASGLRSPLSHIADQVFLSLAEEIESQGASRKVAADMFGLALRGYQRKLQRIEEASSHRERTLWHALLDFLEANGPTPRAKLLAQFSGTEETFLLAVAADLVNGGLLYRSGQGDSTVYGAMPEAARRRFAEEDELNALAGFVWLAAFRHSRCKETDLERKVGAPKEAFERALAALIEQKRVRRVATSDGAVLEAEPFVVEVGAKEGWQAAVFDHFQAVTTAIAAKLRRGGTRSSAADEVGGTTFHFGVHEAHPYRDEVIDSLRRTRTMMEALWHKVTEHNVANPVPEEERTVVTFYFGQTVRRPDEPEEQDS
jgi:hypothetical protein